MIRHVLVADEASVLCRLGAHDGVFRRDASDACARLPKTVTDWKRRHVFRTDEFHPPKLSNGIDIGLLEKDSAARSLTSGLHARLTAARDNRPFGKCISEPVHQRVLKAGAVCHQQDDGDDASGDTHHRERRSKAMRHERANRLRYDLEVKPHDLRPRT